MVEVKAAGNILLHRTVTTTNVHSVETEKPWHSQSIILNSKCQNEDYRHYHCLTFDSFFKIHLTYHLSLEAIHRCPSQPRYGLLLKQGWQRQAHLGSHPSCTTDCLRDFGWVFLPLQASVFSYMKQIISLLCSMEVVIVPVDDSAWYLEYIQEQAALLSFVLPQWLGF